SYPALFNPLQMSKAASRDPGAPTTARYQMPFAPRLISRILAFIADRTSPYFCCKSAKFNSASIRDFCGASTATKDVAWTGAAPALGVGSGAGVTACSVAATARRGIGALVDCSIGAGLIGFWMLA